MIALASLGGAASAEPELRLTSNVIWHHPASWFGGFSGAEVSANGEDITLVTDRGSLVTARLIRTAGKLDTVQINKRLTYKDANGNQLKGKQGDGEGLAIDAGGRAYMSFENDTRVVHLDLTTGQTTDMPPHPDFATYGINKGLEALAIHPDGSLYTLPETSSPKGAPFPLFKLIGGQWQKTHDIPKRGPFLAVGADFDATGRLYLLERAVSPLGFRSRIRRFDPNTGMAHNVTLLKSRPGRFDNMEAISVWTNAAGVTQLTLVSDDNFLSIQRTQIVEFSLTE